MTQAILTINIKGGTGKSTVAEHLAKSLKNRGHTVGVLDADIDSANLASRMDANERVSFEGDHTIEPVEKDGMLIYSMENAFSDSAMVQTGDFMRTAIDNMVKDANWGEVDYLVVDCPPGSSDVFEELVRSLRSNILGAISVGQSDSIDDTARLIKVCNHSWIPIIGFIENMQGMVTSSGFVTDDETGEEVYPFGQGKTKALAEQYDGEYLGGIPLCTSRDMVGEWAEGTLENSVEAIENAQMPKIPEDYENDKGFITNLLKAVLKGVKDINEQFDIDKVQDQFGVEGRDRLVIEMKIKDASGISYIRYPYTQRRRGQARRDEEGENEEVGNRT